MNNIYKHSLVLLLFYRVMNDIITLLESISKSVTALVKLYTIYVHFRNKKIKMILFYFWILIPFIVLKKSQDGIILLLIFICQLELK